MALLKASQVERVNLSLYKNEHLYHMQPDWRAVFSQFTEWREATWRRQPMLNTALLVSGAVARHSRLQVL